MDIAKSVVRPVQRCLCSVACLQSHAASQIVDFTADDGD